MSRFKDLIQIGRYIPLEKSVRGVYPFIFKYRESLKEKQIIIEESFDSASLLMENMELFSEGDYVLIDSSSEYAVYMAVYAYIMKKSIVTDEGFYELLFPKSNKIEESGLFLKRGMKIDIEDIMERLGDFGFERVDNVYERSEFALRGFILDIYGIIGPCIRIEMNDDLIEDIRSISTQTQESLRNEESLFIPMKIDEVSMKNSFKDIFKEYALYDIAQINHESSVDFDINEDLKPLSLQSGSISSYLSENYPDYKIKIFCANDYEEERIKKITSFEAEYFRGNIVSGFSLPKQREVFINDFEIFSRKRYSHFHEVPLSPIALEELESLNMGDVIVHQTYGVGRFAGIERVTYGERYTDCIKIFYENNDKLYVPIDQIRLIDKYIGSKEQEPKLSSLTRNSFEKQKEKVRESLKKIAGELLRLYAEREVVLGYKFDSDDERQIEMEEMFEHEETYDQLKAIEDVKRDMMSSRPMDRLISGEVGYGKTEVAARAAFKAHLCGKQVAFLVPTTILAQQHYETLKERLKYFPIKIEVLSRFVKEKDKQSVKKRIREGDVDIVIGTHALFSNDIEFFDLGLYIIDEEHRFGVKQKEKIKEIKKSIDVLAMSATPIPRTLEMAMTGIKDISNIMTPPAGRKAIKTFVVKWSEDTIKSSILKEISRQGQVYFLHNRIETLKSIEEKLKEYLKDVRIVSVHAKMHSSEIESKMHDFRERKYDMLLSTAIIESGIDNPNVNTMIINRADMFGLAELHQLRGRIGRSQREAFCYLIVPEKEQITDGAKKRLSAFKSYSSLGAGINLAIKDIEMRGAGKILGTQQHGFIGNVGYSLYFKILNEAIDEVKGVKKVSLIEPTINLPGSTFVPDSFNLTKSGKMGLYRDISQINKTENVEKEREKFKDRYGKMPEEISNIFKLQDIKIRCKELLVGKIEMFRKNLYIEFMMGREPNLDEMRQILSKIEEPVEFKHQPSFTIIIKDIEKQNMYDYTLTLLKSLS
ncbi:TPA: transcription-repair coupling factor [candidate division WOR-3 bacterium]|uniref:Transcription-repair-coupling factor n=1 Tax=candidate division WOR-3 bacterium TaxID=2052148 RepID=A0A350H8H2_UNCW3|nr:transcription-repair coupling factor [candidate division WOR-3 bacterium]